ncbi:MAG: tRNA 2-thiocytidine(32) synthetase TtcA [Cycloclasticus sp. symbiont of Bathymodiolus heckerae]|nr:MAG: tRNA 2-thiocytidine(32) synthetase TtcA [Cycloclasticus sp. symbiont of Bathymodiolus heckerae]
MNTIDKSKLRFNKLQKRLRREMGQAIADYNMIEDGDRIMVCLSGGKDSYTMLDILLNLRRSAPVDFDILAVNLDQKQPGFPEHILPGYLAFIDVPYHVIEQDTYSVVTRIIPEGKTTCGLCSRMRRGALYAYAEEHGYNKIALGHHRDDIIETFFLNMFYGGQLKAMPAKLKSDNGKHIVIRPLAYSREKDIAEFSELKGYPIIPCNLCGSQENLQRVQMKKMLNQWDKDFPGRVETIFNSLKNIKPSQLLDGNLFNFDDLSQSPESEHTKSHPVIFPAMQVNE